MEMKAIWQLDDMTGVQGKTCDETDADDFESRIQAVFNELWIKKWKSQMKMQHGRRKQDDII